MCNLYSITKGQRAIIEFTRAMRDTTGNLPPLPGVFPDYRAPIVRNAPDGVRELMMARWGMPSSQFALILVLQELRVNITQLRPLLESLSRDLTVPVRLG